MWRTSCIVGTRSRQLMCGDRSGAKYSKPVKGVQNSRNDDPTRGYLR